MRTLTIPSRCYDSTTNGRRSADAVLGPCDSASRSGEACGATRSLISAGSATMPTPASRSGQASDATGPVDSTNKCDFGDAFDGWRQRHRRERGHSDEITEHRSGWVENVGGWPRRAARGKKTRLGGIHSGQDVASPSPAFRFKYRTYVRTSAHLIFNFPPVL